MSLCDAPQKLRMYTAYTSIIGTKTPLVMRLPTCSRVHDESPGKDGVFSIHNVLDVVHFTTMSPGRSLDLKSKS